MKDYENFLELLEFAYGLENPTKQHRVFKRIIKVYPSEWEEYIKEKMNAV